jgi:hypothetical protein
MKVAIINVSLNKPYTIYQNRLRNSCQQMCPYADLLFWTDELPEGARPHSESLYGFKPHAFNHAFKLGYDVVLWLDSPVVIMKDIQFIFDILDKDGYVVTGCETANLYQYCNDATLEHFNIKRQFVKDIKWILNYGHVFGFKKDSKHFLKFKECEELGLFTSAEEDYQDHLNNSGKAFNNEYIEHRHEETIVSMIIQSEGLELTPYSLIGPCFTFEKTPL